MKYAKLQVISACLCFAACSGAVPSSEPGNPPDDGGGKGGSIPPVSSTCKSSQRELLTARSWRLSDLQYRNSVRALFGVDGPARVLATDVPSGEGFAFYSTHASSLTVGDRETQAFRDAAIKVAADVAPRLVREQSCLGDAKPAASCVEALVNTYAGRAFRRPLHTDESTRLRLFFENSATQWGGAVATRMFVTTLLQHPSFVYRTELGDKSKSGLVQLTPYEVASELAFAFTDTPPDETLMNAAADNQLNQKTVREHALRLLQTPAGRAKLTRFFSEWMELEPLTNGSLTKQKSLFPEFDDTLRAAMVEESNTFVEKVLFEEGGTLKDLFEAKHSYVNGGLAKLYGATAPSSGFARVDLPAERKGLLSHAGVLAARSHPDSTSPAMRGLLVYRNMLCQPVPSPPPGAADQAAGKVVAPNNDYTQREHYEYSKKNAPECVACHGEFVPIGLGFENFDALGKSRTKEFGKTIDTSVRLEGYGDADGEFANALDLASSIVSSDAGRRCFAMQLASFTYGSVMDPEASACEVEALSKRFLAANLSVAELAADLTSLGSFFERRAP